MKNCGLVADVGGTNVRFALVDLDHPRRVALQAPRKLVSRAYGSIVDAAKAYLCGVNAEVSLAAAVFAVAGRSTTRNPAHKPSMALHGRGFAGRPGCGQVHLLNDYEAIAFAVPSLGPGDLLEIGAVSPKAQGAQDGQVIAIVGPGTGLGVAGYVRAPQGVFPLVTEGGHADFAPSDDVEVEILNFLRRRYEHVSAERVLSGSGLVNLHEALCAIEGVAYETRTSHEITDETRKDPGSLSARAFGRFCAIMGSVCGNVALTMGARDGC